MLRADFKAFLRSLIIVFLCCNAAIIVAFVWLLVAESGESSEAIFVALIAFFTLANLFFFFFLLYRASVFINARFAEPLGLFLNDMQDFYSLNKSHFHSWACRIIREPEELVETSRFFHNNIAKQIYDLQRVIGCDPLTKLKTSIVLSQDVEEYVNHVVAVVNINNFKEINSFYGVEIADKILCFVADVLRGYFRDESYRLYRIYADDFAVLWTCCTDRVLFVQRLEGFLDYLTKQEVLLDNYTSINIAATIGIAFSIDSAKYSAINAQMALHHAKEYKNPIVIYNRNLPILSTFKNNVQYSEIIFHAIKNDAVLPVYQKIIPINAANLPNNRTKFEALMRIKDKDGTIIPPGAFLSIAKRSSAYGKLSRMMIEKSFAFLSTREDLVFSVNLTLDDMLSSDFCVWFMNKIVHYNLENRVIVEITEQESITDFGSVNNFVTNIKELGVQIALDDFGSGYSNFSVLMQLQIDYLKLDGSLIKNIDKDNNAKIIVKTIVQFAKSLKIATVAEFVSTQEIYEVVKELGVDYAQGYFIGKPTEGI